MSGHKIDFDLVLAHIGPFGTYSALVFIMACIASFMCAQPVVQDAFVSLDSPHRYREKCPRAVLVTVL